MSKLNKQKIAILFLSVTFLLNGCKKEETKPDEMIANRSLKSSSLNMDLLLNGNKVKTVKEAHDYVKLNGFTDDLNGISFRMHTGQIQGGSQLISDKNPVLPRQEAFNLAAENAANAYAVSIFNPQQAEMDLFQSSLKLIGSNGAGLSPYINFKKDDFIIQTDPDKPDFGLSKFDKEQLAYFDASFKKYNLYQSYLNQYSSMTDEERIQELTKQYTSVFRPLVAKNYKGFDSPFSIGEILPWLRNNKIGTSRNAFCLNLAERIQYKDFTAAVISDILTTKDGKWVGVMLNIATENSFGSERYMFVGDTKKGDMLPYSWESEKTNKNPWELQPDYKVVKPINLAAGPPTIKTDPRDLNPGGSGQIPN